MKKIVGLIGSPRKLGNSELMVKEISRNIPVEHELLLINLVKMNLKPCTGCYQCLFKAGECPLKDDMSTVIETLRGADGVILAAPTYFLGAYGTVKVFTDRSLMVLAEIEEFYGKPAVVVTLAGIEGKEGHSQMALAASASSLGFHVKDQATVYAALPGEVFLGGQNKEIAAHFGKVLLDPDYVRKPMAYECSLCSGNAIKFLGDDRVECLSCHNPGKIKWQDGKPCMEMISDPHNILGDLEARLDHRAWLMGMKDNFMDKKKILKEITAGYLKEGKWVRKEKES